MVPTVLIKAINSPISTLSASRETIHPDPPKKRSTHPITLYVSVGMGGSMAFNRTADLLLNYYINGNTMPAFTQSRPSYILRSDNTVTTMPSVAVGIEYNKRWNFELGYLYTKNSLDVTDDDSFTTNTIKGHTILANANLKVLPDKRLTPYVGIGVGIGFIQDANTASVFLGALNGSSLEFDTKKLAALTTKSIMGMEWKLNKSISLGAEYNLLYTNINHSQTQYINTPVAAGAPGLSVDRLDLKINFKDYFSHNFSLKLKCYF